LWSHHGRKEWHAEIVDEDFGSTRAALPQRLLRLLSLLQTRRMWSAGELTERLGVSARTLRRDVERLRSLDYQVESVTGVAGGYRLAAGSDLPPLLLDDEEAVATAVGLSTATGVGDAAVRALAKLERVLPARLRPRLVAVGRSAEVVRFPDASDVDAGVLGTLASACQDHTVIDVVHRGRGGERERRVEPHHLVAHGGHWYLIAHDAERDDWRTFRVDRVRDPRPTHRRFTPRALPADDPPDFLTRHFAAATYRYTAVLTVELPAAELRRRLYGPLPGQVVPRDEHSCRVRISADSPDLVCQYTAAVASLGAPFTLDADPAVTARLAAVGDRLAGGGAH
jgi:predicted DNA-binding transcriptional regulator YafY